MAGSQTTFTELIKTENKNKPTPKMKNKNYMYLILYSQIIDDTLKDPGRKVGSHLSSGQASRRTRLQADTPPGGHASRRTRLQGGHFSRRTFLQLVNLTGASCRTSLQLKASRRTALQLSASRRTGLQEDRPPGGHASRRTRLQEDTPPGGQASRGHSSS